MHVNILDIHELLEKEKGGILLTNEISENVGNITKDIQSYKNDDDIAMLKKLKRLCARKALCEETANMVRNIGMYYFYRNNTDKAARYLNESIRIAKEHKNYNLLVGFLSDKGLILFYDLKYKQAKRLFLHAFETLPDTDNPDEGIKYLLYYRTGILYSYMGDYAGSYAMLNEALGHAGTITDKGWAISNIGINYERQGRFDEAIECFNDALKLYGEDYSIDRSRVYNNIAESYKNIGNYEKALEYINNAFELLGCKNMGIFFIFFQTYTDIKVLQGEPKEDLEKLIELLSQVKDFFIYKCFIIDGINIAIKASSEDKKSLSKLNGEILTILDSIGQKSKVFKRELSNLLSDICLSLSVLGSK